jgi:hypothetical protein
MNNPQPFQERPGQFVDEHPGEGKGPWREEDKLSEDLH